MKSLINCQNETKMPYLTSFHAVLLYRRSFYKYVTYQFSRLHILLRASSIKKLTLVDTKTLKQDSFWTPGLLILVETGFTLPLTLVTFPANPGCSRFLNSLT